MSFNEKFNSKMVSVEPNAIGRRKKKEHVAVAPNRKCSNIIFQGKTLPVL